MNADQAMSLVVAWVVVAASFFGLGYVFGWLSDAGKEAFARRWAAAGIRQDRAIRARLRARHRGTGSGF